MTTRTRSLELTAERLRAYSRRGNFHSEPEEASRLGLPGLLAQGMQVAGPAYGLLLDEWGEEFLSGGELEVKFVGMVSDGEVARATVHLDGDAATVEVVNDARDATAVVGRARRAFSA